MKNIYVGIMAGGAGTRFWPVSREAHPKQFIDILGNGKTLLQNTYNRFTKLCPQENIFFITNQKYGKLIREQIPEIRPKQIIKEPSRRNTAPCIAYAANKIHAMNKDALLVVAPSDHYIQKESAFISVIKKALTLATNAESLVTIGIKPNRPDTGYGYIQFDKKKKHLGAHKVKMFTEKPNDEMAKKFVKSGEFLWNSGIFIWKTDTILKAFKDSLPDMYDIFNDADNKHYNKRGESAFIKKAYSLCTNISIDYGIMEKGKNVHVIPGDFGWSDLGTWGSVYNKVKKDSNKNVIQAKSHMIQNSKNNMLHINKEKLLVVDGLSDFIVVDSDDVLLILPREKEQDVKKILNEVRQNKGSKYL